MLPALLWILHAEDADLKHIAEITRTDIFDGASNDFHDEGLFSTRIFGLVGSPERDEVYGKINLMVRIIHPKIYRDLIGMRELYKDILAGTRTAKFDTAIGDFVPSMGEDAQTGYSFFFENMQNISLKANKSPARSERIKFLERWRHRWTMKNLIVMPAGLRDVEVGDDGRPTKHEINDLYWRVLSATKTITKSNDMISPVYDTVRHLLQNNVNDLYKYMENMQGGKGGFLKDRWASRRVREGTRNVLTSMDTSGIHLDSPNVPSFDSSMLGVYQAAVSLAPLVIHWLRNGSIAKIATAGEGAVPLVDPKTLKQVWVDLPPAERDRWTTKDGLRDVINSLIDVEARHRPVVIAGNYLSLVYLGEESFKIFDSIDQLPKAFDSAAVHPITLMELIYLAGYAHWSKYFTDIVRYPIEGDDSTYPSRLYVRSTSVGEVRYELDDHWHLSKKPENMAVEYPKFGLTTYHDSESPHPSRLSGLGADFDGDTGSATTVMVKESLEETERYLGTRAAWVRPDGRPRASVVYDTAELVVRNLTSRFDHVRQAPTPNIKHVLGPA
jgi:hypothetical protein